MTQKHCGFSGFRAALGAVVLSIVLPASSPLDAQLGAARSRWWSDVDRVGRVLEAGKWRKAVKQGEDLREEVMRSSWRQPDLCAGRDRLPARSGPGPPGRGRGGGRGTPPSTWSGPSREIAERDLAPYGKAGELLAAHPLRAFEEYPPGYPEVEVRPDRDFEHAEQREGFELEPLVNTAATREVVDPVTLEVLIDAQGRIHQPVLVTPWSHPVTVQWALDNLWRSQPFGPARMNGEPVAVLRAIEFHVGDPSLLEGESWDIH